MAESTAKPGRENSAKMLLTTTTPTTATATTVSTVHPPLPSPPGGDALDENSNKFITYLQQLAGHHEVEMDVVAKDHPYARPWNWKPENIYVKPAKKLFFSKTQAGAAK